MPGETITIQAGQCGNQVGFSYWQQLAQEHGLSPDGTPSAWPHDTKYEFIDYSRRAPTDGPANQEASGSSSSGNGNGAIRPLSSRRNQTSYRDDNPELFFTISDADRYTPRAILIDLEPSVISKTLHCMPMFNPRNAHVSEQGSGAANNWSNGYRYGQEHIEEMVNLIDREVDKCDNLSHFQLIHSVAGGTGSGVGSRILEVLQDRYTSKKITTTVSVFPSNDKTSDVVVQPYNSILTLKRLIENSDGTFVFHNDALNNIENLLHLNHASAQSDGISGRTSFSGANKLIASVVASISNPIRFPGYMYTSIESIMATMVPTPELKFLTTSIAPFSTLATHHKYVNEYDMFLELSDDRYKSVILNNNNSTETYYLSLMNFLISPKHLDRREIRKGILKIQERTNFPSWASRTIGVVQGKQAPFVTDRVLQGIQLSNNTAIVELFEKILRQFDMLAKRKAYLNTYCEENSVEEVDRVAGVFAECRETVQTVIEEYKACKSINYLEDDDLDVNMN
ncbi:uncharacterized protein LODBEIA_P52260 [Lodderomyces beijingensis]|uniref:Tubulin gamma chain n=1 Tax=Lodderomyces beijingensis TaxID=1775926 RepID=A0ABP0ZUJ0_9ASCO